MKVLKYTKIENIKFNENELIELFNDIKISNDVTVDDSIIKEYDEKSKETIVKPKSKDDVCPICFEDLDDGTALDFCKNKCGKYVHDACFKLWSSKNIATCVFCRYPWNETKNEYINLTKK